ncbi:conserved exported hypothetical protein [Cupriavidus taiwanensis]|uniref:Uncharacterized protein n=1 Tax=Cupriavidus taiwanensis TaxID=164546 RepID=A0A375E5L7_9BURK|nr:hypothetical protein [Cupriavidus taiwanensis]SOZ57679.1 conserved exported hypothetical protein [Cupriavidus taiwanensis]SOZ58313.1 conserved exported hypothetical protein [Cupriavidus taiwanensis]SOZ61788.1 conserved exported hypothetical protein [Cupriavidus taiwanensis]SOZ99102.1 conserved exported hypothetical protein [Cupriavidus taiwanensis]SPA05998.1 conserved exported hypothetical protein [Cupriavidus taiwanensis]
MEAVRERILVAFGVLCTAIASSLVSVNVRAEGMRGDGLIPKGMQRYVLPMRDCALEFVAKAGGTARVTPSDDSWGTFWHGSYLPKKNERALSMLVSCHRGSAKKLCPELMSQRRESDPMMIRDTQQRDLSGLNPRYYSDAAIATATAVATPRSRDLHFCLGDETRTIVTMNGGIVVGFDPREITETRGKPILKRSEQALPDVLAIIRSMRFVPDPTPKQDSR